MTSTQIRPNLASIVGCTPAELDAAIAAGGNSRICTELAIAAGSSIGDLNIGGKTKIKLTGPFKVHAVVLDGTNPSTIEPALADAMDFLTTQSRLALDSTIAVDSNAHTLDAWVFDWGTAYTMSKLKINALTLAALPVADMYLFFFKTGGLPPLQAGSTWNNDLVVGGLPRAYASIPTDVWWWNDDDAVVASGGFHTGKASIMAHEIDNQLNQILTASPFLSPILAAGEGLPKAWDYESSRLAKIDTATYSRIESNRNGAVQTHLHLRSQERLASAAGSSRSDLIAAL